MYWDNYVAIVKNYYLQGWMLWALINEAELMFNFNKILNT